MGAFTAILLVCAMPVDPGRCDEAFALDLISISVDSELGCNIGWQQIMARSSLGEGLGERFYIKARCRRNGVAAPHRGSRLEADGRR